jgi:hypothetical protein
MDDQDTATRQGNLVALTWQQITIGLLILPLMLAIGFACNAPPRQQILAYGLVGGMVLIVAMLTVLHRRSVGRRDLEPDVLAILFDAQEIRECDGVHLVGRARQVDAAIRWEFAVQNLMSAPRRAEIKISALNDENGIMGQAPTVVVALGASAVAVTRIDVPLRPTARGCTLAVQYQVRTSGDGGKRVRFARRDVIAEPNNTLATATIATGLIAGAPGAVRAGRSLLEDGFLPAIEVDIEPGWGAQVTATSGASAALAAKSSAVLWTPGDEVDHDRLRARYGELMRGSGQFPVAA